MLKQFESIIGYQFNNEDILRNALTHSSYANENRGQGIADNERVEFLGDSILGFVVAEHLFRQHPDKPEGELTRMRADLVCEKALAAAARKISLGDYLLLGHGEIQNGGKHRDSILSDAMESVLAAVYLDGGFHRAKALIDALILGAEKVEAQNKDYKTMLQELVQRKKNQAIRYELVGESGPDHDKMFCVRVLLNDKVVGSGTGTSKKRAEQDAAHAAIMDLFPNEA